MSKMNVCFRLEPTQREQLNKLAQQHQVKPSVVLRRAVERYVNDELKKDAKAS